MAVNLINSSDIEVEQTGSNVQLKTSTPLSTITGGISDNTNDIQNIKDGNVYSTNEVKTNKVWIDNKPIYRRVYQYTSTASSDNINIADWNIETTTFMQGLIYDTTSKQLDTNYYISSTDYFRLLTRLYNNNHTITVQRGNANSRLITIILEYTKTN